MSLCEVRCYCTAAAAAANAAAPVVRYYGTAVRRALLDSEEVGVGWNRQARSVQEGTHTQKHRS